MKKQFVVFVLVLLVVACSGMSQRQKTGTAVGAVGGAAVGAVIGGAYGGNTGAWIGGLIGAGVGGLAGHQVGSYREILIIITNNNSIPSFLFSNPKRLHQSHSCAIADGIGLGSKFKAQDAITDVVKDAFRIAINRFLTKVGKDDR